jgi:hypothetical protein
MNRLFVIEDVFPIKEREVVVVGPYDDPDNARFVIGDEVEIRRLDGTTRRAVISGLPMRPMKINYAEVLLRYPITKEDVGPGDEIWSLPKGPAEPKLH